MTESICTMTGKQCLSKSEALRRITQMGSGDPDAHQLNAYRCCFCQRHHVGHRREPGDSAPLRRLNA